MHPLCIRENSKYNCDLNAITQEISRACKLNWEGLKNQERSKSPYHASRPFIYSVRGIYKRLEGTHKIVIKKYRLWGLISIDMCIIIWCSCDVASRWHGFLCGFSHRAMSVGWVLVKSWYGQMATQLCCIGFLFVMMSKLDKWIWYAIQVYGESSIWACLVARAFASKLEMSWHVADLWVDLFCLSLAIILQVSLPCLWWQRWAHLQQKSFQCDMLYYDPMHMLGNKDELIWRKMFRIWYIMLCLFIKIMWQRWAHMKVTILSS